MIRGEIKKNTRVADHKKAVTPKTKKVSIYKVQKLSVLKDT